MLGGFGLDSGLAGLLDASWLVPWLLQVAGLLLGCLADWLAGWLGHCAAGLAGLAGRRT